MTQHKIAHAYVRLSRADERQGGTMEEKWKIRAAICEMVAKENGLILPSENIHFEQVSGAKLSNRPEALKLVALARDGKLPHLVTPYIDRLLRGDKRDEQDFEDAFCLGGTRLYHAEGAPIHFGDDYDPLILELKSLVARQELRGYSKKLRTTNRERLRLAQRSHGAAPYGYRYVPAQHNERGETAVPPRHVVIPEEMAIVREMFRRILGESLQAMADDFNRRGVPPPTASRGVKNAAVQWHPSAIGRMVANPFYKGFLAQRRRSVRGREVRLAPEDWILSEVAGDWETAVSEETWKSAQRQVQHRKQHGASSRLLTGILFCAAGEPMAGGPDNYTCQCGNRNSARLRDRERHPGWAIRSAKIDQYARDLVIAVVNALPEGVVGSGPGRRKPTAQELTAARRDLAGKQRSVDDMIARREWHMEMFGEEAYTRAAMRTRGEVQSLTAEVARLESAAAEPDREQSVSLVAAIRAVGAAYAWDQATPEERRVLVRVLVRRITLLPKAARTAHRGADVVLWDWCGAGASAVPGMGARRSKNE